MKTDYQKQLEEKDKPDILGIICIALLIIVYLAGCVWVAKQFAFFYFLT